MAAARTVVIRFRVGSAPPYDDDAESSLGSLWSDLAGNHPGIDMRRRIRAVSRLVLEALAGANMGSAAPGAARLLRTFEIRCPPGVDPFSVLADVKGWARVESAYVQPRLRGALAVVDYSDDPDFRDQGYLLPAPVGLNALCAWQLSNGSGQNVAMVDIEAGWNPNHQDLPASVDLVPLYGANSSDANDQEHGLMTLGVLAAADNDKNCVGFAPNVSALRLASYNGPLGSDEDDLENAIIAAHDYLKDKSAGLILLECELAKDSFAPGGPVDLLPAVRDTILTAVSAGIVLVEAAGNGASDLAELPDADGNRALDPSSCSYEDSGAILVGAATPDVPHEPVSTSWRGNNGDRVDCYAWGQDVRTLWDKTGTTLYEGTSSAAAIVAGAAAVLQGIAHAHLGAAFSPADLRRFLRDPANGTESSDPARDRIGPMPDLAKLIRNCVPIAVPDVYARDFVGDDGSTLPTPTPLYMSPDIIVRRSHEANPQAAFGEGSGTENDAGLSDSVLSGTDHWVYLRVRNRGGVDATNIEARIYWTQPSTLMLPETWNEIGTVLFPSVPTGDVLTVSSGLMWSAAEVPATGHYCFLAEIVDPFYPTPMKTAMADWGAFVHFVRSENNVVWRNFQVIEYTPASLKSAVLEARIGAPRGKRPKLSVDLVVDLPPDSRVTLDLADDWLGRVETAPPMADTGGGRRRIARVGRTRIVEGKFPEGDGVLARIRVSVPDHARPRPGKIVLIQSDERGELGRVTWKLVPKREGEAD